MCFILADFLKMSSKLLQNRNNFNSKKCFFAQKFKKAGNVKECRKAMRIPGVMKKYISMVIFIGLCSVGCAEPPDELNRCNSEGYTPLMVACGATLGGSRETRTEAEIAAKSPEPVHALLTAGADVNARGKGSRWGVTNATALMHCAWRGSLAELQLLIAAGADINAADSVGDTALMRAAQRGNAEMVKALLAAGADPNAQDKRGWTALMGACVSRNTPDTAIAQALIDAGTQLELKNEHGFTALSYAAQSGKLEHVKCLLAAGAELNSRDKQGRNVLHRALECKVAPAMVRCLLLAGAEPRQVHPFLPAEDYLLADAVYHGQPAEIIQQLIEAGANVNGSEVLRSAVYAADSRVQTVLLAAGADPNRGNPLAGAISRGKGVAYIKELIAAGADVNRALFSAALYNPYRVQWLSLLVESGANVNLRGENGNTPFQVAMLHGNLPALQVLLAAGAKPLSVNDCGESSLTMLMNIRCTGLTHIDRWVAPGDSAMGSMSEADYMRLIRSLKAAEMAPVTDGTAAFLAEWNKPEKLTPLMQAVCDGNAARVAEQLATGADVDEASPLTGRTPLMVAADWLFVDVVKVLLAAGADVNRRDNRGNTALMYAQTHPGLHGGINSLFYTNGQDATYACTELLLRHGADVLARNVDGVSALDFIADDFRPRNELLRKAAAEQKKGAR